MRIESEYAGFVYITTNQINGKMYAGKCGFSQGWRTYLGSGTLLLKALKKYGRSNFSREVIGYAKTQSALDGLERRVIKLLRELYSPENLYNIADGGEGFTVGGYNPMYDRAVVEVVNKGRQETRDREGADDKHRTFMKTLFANEPWRASLHSKRISKLYSDNPELKTAISESCKSYYRNNPEARLKVKNRIQTAYKDNPEIREKQSQTRKELLAKNPELLKQTLNAQRMATESAVKKLSKPVVSTTSDSKESFWYQSSNTACRILGGSGSNKISLLCRGKLIGTYKGLSWRYATEEENSRFEGLTHCILKD